MFVLTTLLSIDDGCFSSKNFSSGKCKEAALVEKIFLVVGVSPLHAHKVHPTSEYFSVISQILWIIMQYVCDVQSYKINILVKSQILTTHYL